MKIWELICICFSFLSKIRGIEVVSQSSNNMRNISKMFRNFREISHIFSNLFFTDSIKLLKFCTLLKNFARVEIHFSDWPIKSSQIFPEMTVIRKQCLHMAFSQKNWLFQFQSHNSVKIDAWLQKNNKNKE